MRNEAPEPRAPQSLPMGLGLIIGLAVLAIFAKSLGGAFIDDDLALIARSPWLQDLSSWTQRLAEPMWSDIAGLSGEAQLGLWRPLTSTVLALGFSLGGGPDSPWVFHLLSIGIHLVAVLAAFRLARRLLKNELAGAAVALLFALHPIQVASLAWTSSIATPLAGALVLLALDAWLAWREEARTKLPWLAFGFTLAALLSNEFALAILPILVVLDLLVGHAPKPSRAMRPWIFLLGVVAFWFGLRLLVFGDLTAALGRVNADYAGSVWRARGELLGGGVWHLFVPTALSATEPFREAWPVGSVDARNKTIGLGLLALLVTAGVLALRRLRVAKPGLLLATSLGILAAVSPAILGVRGLGKTPFADQYWYLAVFFFALFVVAALRMLTRQKASRSSVLWPVLLLSTWYGIRDIGAQEVWSSPEAFYREAIARQPDVPHGHWNLGEILRQKFIDSIDSDGAIEISLLNEAFVQYERSATLLAQANTDATIPKGELDYLRTGLGQAWCYLLQAEYDEYRDFDTPQRILEMLLEQVELREAGNRATGNRHARLPIEEVLTTLGTVKLRAEKVKGAENDFRKALQVNPNYLPALRNLGTLRFRAGQFALSSSLFLKALALAPKQAALLELYAQSLFQEGWDERALEVSAELEQVDASNPTPEILRGLVALKKRDFSLALGHFDHAIGLSPRSSVALFQRGMTLYQMGEADQAIAALRRACEEDTEDFTAHYNLASMLFERGVPEIAKPYLERAYAAGTDRPELQTMRMSLLELDPKNAVRMRALAELDDSRNDTQGALFWTERALVIDPENGRSRHLKGRLLLDAKESLLALPELLHATELLPSGYLPFFDLGRCLIELGKYDEAREALGRSRELVAELKGPVGPDVSEEALMGFKMLQEQEFAKIDNKLSSLP